MATSYTVSGTLTRTIDINSSSAMAKANAFFQMKDRLNNTISDSKFRTNFSNFLTASGESGVPILAEGASVIASVIEVYYPSREAAVIQECLNAASLFIDLSDDIGSSIYPKWKVQLLYKLYKANDGNYFDMVTGYQVVGKYTPTGQLITTT